MGWLERHRYMSGVVDGYESPSSRPGVNLVSRRTSRGGGDADNGMGKERERMGCATKKKTSIKGRCKQGRECKPNGHMSKKTKHMSGTRARTGCGVQAERKRRGTNMMSNERNGKESQKVKE